MDKKDFFISYTGKDKKWATWIAGVLEANGYTTCIQAWDFKAGGNFVWYMDKGLIDCERFIAVLSAEYMQHVYCQAEWTAALAKDPIGEKGLFIPIRIDDYEPEGLLKPIVYIDLFGIDEEEAEERLKQITEEGIPRNKPGFPGTKKPRFPGQLPLNNIPYTNNIHFTGRKEILLQIDNSLKPGEKNPCSIALCGMGGVGKTQIALAYALNNGYLYNTIWWINAENELTMLDSYKDLLMQKGIIKRDVTYEKDDILQSIWAWMSQNTNWLFIYDNAERESDLSQYLPRINTGHILVTTRNPHWRNMKKLEVDVFQPEEAVEFFNNFKLEGSIDDAIKLAKELGYLPLAQDQAVAYMLETNKSYQDYIDLFKQNRLEIFGEVEYESISYGQTVATTWDISLNKIGNEGAKQLIQLFSFLAPDHIHKGIFLQSSEHLPEPLASDARDELKLNNALKDLTRYSLIKTDKGQISIHRLLQEVIRESLGSEKIRCFHLCATILHKLFVYDQYDMKTWEICTSLIPHVQSVLTHEEDLKTETEEIAGLYAEGVGWLQHIALYEEALEWSKKALTIQEKILIHDHQDMAMTYSNIASVYSMQGEYNKALEWSEKALAIREKVLGLDHPDTAMSYNIISTIYARQGKNNKALEWSKKALAIREKVLGHDHPNTAMSYNNIAGIYHNQGEYDKALKWQKKALSIQEKILDPYHPDKATTYNNIAGIYRNKGEYDKALEEFKRALAIEEKVLDPDHPDKATTYNNIAGIYADQREYDKALEWSKKALAIQKKVLSPDHPDMARSYNNIAFVYSGQGKYEKALELYNKALVINEKVLGHDHPYTAATYNNIAGMYYDRGEYDKALEGFKRASAIREKVLGRDHPDTVATYNNIATLYFRLGEYKQALEWYGKIKSK
ncbi:MAG: tetratricopeptide repeat protein [Clostridiaceae bacterium]|jgi:tetratricopeptide (TPR) repeat protein|nr:tetratricopeptide repeat protein [Clostridiaceae bacterium]